MPSAISSGVTSSSPEPEIRHPGEQLHTLEHFIRDCRKLNCLVILTSASEHKSIEGVDYLVDTVIGFDYRDADNLAGKPYRIFSLHKTRHQISRPGDHILHLSGDSGFRISPQVPSQCERRNIWETTLPNRNSLIRALNVSYSRDDIACLEGGNGVGNLMRPLHRSVVDIYSGSHILVHGTGSAGKSGFGLKLLLSPSYSARDQQLDRRKMRVLVVSFLYPQEYYKELRKRLIHIITHEHDVDGVGDVETLHLSPGYLSPEDLFSKIARSLDRAELEGDPFTGVLLDGLHNVFLQFPRLENAGTLWPMVYSYLRTYNLTVVTTHTSFSVPGAGGWDDTEYMLKQAKPMLHALVQAADFFLDISETTLPDELQSDNKRLVYKLTVLSALNQMRPSDEVYWHRELFVLYSKSNQMGLLFPKTNIDSNNSSE